MDGTILIADSHAGELGELRSLLRANGYVVQLVGTGRDALLAFAARPPAAVLVDIELPDMDGVALCDRLKLADERRDVPVLFLGDGDDIQQRVDAIERGGIDFIPRPFAAAEVLARVKRQVTVARARLALQESAAKFRAATESAIDAIVSADGMGEVLSWNRAAERLFGYTEAEMLGERLDRIIPERYRSAHREGIERVGSGGPSRIIGSIVEIEALHKDGHDVPVELSLTAWKLDGQRYFTGILRDVSERKEAEQRFRSVTESAIDAIVSSDASSTVVGWNRAAEQMFGWPAHDIIGLPLETIIPERFRKAHRAGMDRLTHTGDSRVIGKTVELAALRRDGTEFPIELSLSTWTVEADRYYTGIIRDISARKEAEAGSARSPSRKTRTGQFVGTPSYMAPERLRPDSPETELSDVYGAGVALYEALTGRLPIPPRRTLVQTIRAYLDSQPIPLARVLPGIDGELEALVSRSLAADPLDRPSASQLQAALHELAVATADEPAAELTSLPDEAHTVAMPADTGPD